MKRWTVRSLAAGLLVAWALVAGTTAQAAGSQPGIAGLAPPPPGLQQGNQPTLQERYPSSAYLPFNVDLGSVIGATVTGESDPVSQAMNVAASSWASTVMGVVLLVAEFTSSLIQWAFSMDVVAGAGGPLSRVVQALADQIYMPLVGSLLGLVGIWLVWHLLLRRRHLTGLEGAAWALFALVGGAVYMAAPVQLMSGIDQGTEQLSRGMLAAVATADPGLSSRGSDSSLSQGDASSAELRLVTDRYWRTFVFIPWCMGQLGDVSPSGQRLGEEYLAKQLHQPSNFDQDIQNSGDVDWYHGSQGGQRLAIAFVALAVVLVASVLYLLIAGTVVVSQLALLMLLMVAPLFLLVGVHPGTGRRLLVRWAELVGGALLVRVLAATFLAVVMVLSGLANSVTGSNWALQGALQIGLVVTALIYRRPFLRVFGQLASPRMAISHVSRLRAAEPLHRAMDRRAMMLWRERGASALPAGGGASAARALTGATGAAGKAVGAAAHSAAAPVAGAAAATGAKAATGAAGTVSRGAGGAGTAGLALVAVEAGKLGLKGVAYGIRKAQGATSPLLLNGAGHVPPAPRMPRGSRGVVDAVGLAVRGRRERRALGQARMGAGVGADGATPAAVPTRAKTARQRTGHEKASQERKEPVGRTYTNWKGETVNVRSSKIVLPGSWQRERSERRP